MRTVVIIAISLSLILVASDTMFAADQPYSVRSRDMGITGFDYTVTEITRLPRISVLSIPGFHDRSAAASRWMMCVYTDLAIRRGFQFWATVYPEPPSVEIIVGFPSSENEDLTKTLGPKFTGKNSIISLVKHFAQFCGMELGGQTPLEPIR